MFPWPEPSTPEEILADIQGMVDHFNRPETQAFIQQKREQWQRRLAEFRAQRDGWYDHHPPLRFPGPDRIPLAISARRLPHAHQLPRLLIARPRRFLLLDFVPIAGIVAAHPAAS